MSPNRVIEAAIRAAQDFLWQNAPPMHYVADEATVARLRDLMRSPAVQAALLQSSDAGGWAAGARDDRNGGAGFRCERYSQPRRWWGTSLPDIK